MLQSQKHLCGKQKHLHRTRGNVLKLLQDQSVLEIRIQSFKERVVKHLNRLSREGIESPFLEAFRKLENRWFIGEHGGIPRLTLRLDDPKHFF